MTSRPIERTVIETIPERRQPKWFVNHGRKVEIEHSAPQDGQLILANGSVAMLTIGRKTRGASRFDISWHIANPDGNVAGSLEFQRRDLLAAFGIDSFLDESGRGMAQRLGYEVDSAEQGKYFRSGRFLNIPHPGTGDQGDPNISLRVTDEIQKAVLDLIEY